MSVTDGNGREHRVLILAPTGKDAALTRSILDRANVASDGCRDLEEVCRELESGAAAVLLTEETVSLNPNSCLLQWLRNQPSWSDLPVLILARPGAESDAVAQSMDRLGNVTVLERPMRVATLVSALRTALRARNRQYQQRDALVERERHIQEMAYVAAIVASSDDAIISKT